MYVVAGHCSAIVASPWWAYSLSWSRSSLLADGGFDFLPDLTPPRAETFSSFLAAANMKEAS